MWNRKLFRQDIRQNHLIELPSAYYLPTTYRLFSKWISVCHYYVIFISATFNYRDRRVKVPSSAFPLLCRQQQNSSYPQKYALPQNCDTFGAEVEAFSQWNTHHYIPHYGWLVEIICWHCWRNLMLGLYYLTDTLRCLSRFGWQDNLEMDGTMNLSPNTISCRDINSSSDTWRVVYH